MIEFTLPLPCSVNTLYTVVRGRKILSSKGREWKLSAWAELKNLKLKTITCPVSVSYAFTFPDNRKRDISNYIKQVEDAIVNAGIIIDDSQVWAFSAVKKVLKDIRCVEVIIEEIGK